MRDIFLAWYVTGQGEKQKRTVAGSFTGHIASRYPCNDCSYFAGSNKCAQILREHAKMFDQVDGEISEDGGSSRRRCRFNVDTTNDGFQTEQETNKRSPRDIE